MKTHYDEKIGAIHVELDGSEVLESEEVQPGIVFDFDAAGHVVGMEVRSPKLTIA